MKRKLNELEDTEFDIVIIGGGIFGACAAWDATLRGLRVALIERGDFCGGTSANSFKMIHGGVRYLQHADIYRLRYSCKERSALLRIAPHLVQPLPIVIPTYGHGASGKAFLGAGLYLYDLLTLGRNRGISDNERKIPVTRFLGRKEILELFPDLKQKGLTGGAMFSDGQMYNPTRLVLAFIQSAVASGASAFNYLEAVGLMRDGDRVTGVQARDVLTGDLLSIRAKVVLNTAGPWAEHFLGNSTGVPLKAKGTYSRDACFVINKRLPGKQAVAVLGRTRDPDAVLSRPARHLFLVPWRNFTLVGVWHVVWDRSPDEVTVTADDLESFIDEINWAYPSLDLTLKDVRMWNAGLVPFGINEPGATNLSYGKRSNLIDHRKTDNVDGLVTLIGIRYTTARADSAKAIDIAVAKLGAQKPRPDSSAIPIMGGDIPDFEDFVQRSYEKQRLGIDISVMRALAHNYGTCVDQVLAYAEKDPDLAQTLGDTTVIKAEVLNAIEHEMAVTLADVVFRRTDLATAGNPGDETLRECASLAARELGWTDDQTETRLQEVYKRFPSFVTDTAENKSA
ncbi:glycerol-3-phosphate dehydrogenase [Thiogranum longum]|uniref:Glycerol-3-phosphate dehydrogenase n=1 Tax=Thiogranum longum TaxID=1537524 RepID=A0A4R1HFS1_9GAMM|nr:glycerol-3-phosphate dehydrogenase/oxidase [Thiogranum longum]TCK18189.1 glycerol-3-phosphate dehydrogenase [Thiogranum longum]